VSSVIDLLLHQVRLASRSLRRSPGFAGATIGTMALGIGAATAIFSVVYAIALRPLPYPDAARLMALFENNPAKGIPRFSVSPANFVDWRKSCSSFSGMAAIDTGHVVLTGFGEPQRLAAAGVTEDFFRVAGVPPLLGRALGSGDFIGTGAPVVVVSERFWRTQLGGDQSAIGRAVVVDGKPLTVVGVAPSVLRLPDADIDLWQPIVFDADSLASRGAHWLDVVGRLVPGAAETAAASELDGVARQLEASYPNSNRGWHARLESLQTSMVGDARRGLLVLLGAVALLLAVACVNVANLFLVRGESHRRELAVRLAIGASRRDLVAGRLAEAALVVAAGGALGLLLARLALAAFLRFGGADLPRLEEVGIDGSALLFTLAITILTAVVFGLLPALEAARLAGHNALHATLGGGRATTGRAGFRRLLVAAEVALTLVLLVGAGLLLRTLGKVMAVNPGFETRQALTFRVGLAGERYERQAAIGAFFTTLDERLARLPGIEHAGGVSALPLSGVIWNLSFRIVGHPEPGPDETSSAEYRVVTPDYFRAVGIPLREGRFFSASDRPEGQLVAIVSETFVRRYFAHESPLGKQLTMGDRTPQPRTIVGVVADTHELELTRAAVPEVYVSSIQKPVQSMSFVLRAKGDPLAVAPAVRATVAGLDRDLPIVEMRLLDAHVKRAMARHGLSAGLLGVFAALALLLAVVGLYGVVSYAVAARQREIAVRRAVGAENRHVLRLVLGESLRLTLLGIAVGSGLALGATRLLAGLLFEVDARDPLSFAGTAAVLILAALAAAALPARRALAASPSSVLRAE